MIVTVAVLVGIAVWVVAARTGGGTPPGVGARLIQPGDLTAIGVLAGHPVFWAGSRRGTALEFSDDGAGNVHLRYLDSGAEAGTRTERFLNIGTYPFTGAYRATASLARSKGLTTVRVIRGGIGFIDPDRPYSVVLAWPTHPDLQVEVFDPVRYRALRVVRSGDIVPVP